MTNYEIWKQNLIGNLSNKRRDIIKENLKHCKTDKSVLSMLDNMGVKYLFPDHEDDYDYFNLYLPGRCRIYKVYNRNEYKIQAHIMCDMTYSGAPMFSDSKSYF